MEENKIESLNAQTMKLSNGMKITIKKTPFQDDQILMSGYAVGGLSDEPLNSIRLASMAATLASEIGIFGHDPPGKIQADDSKPCTIFFLRFPAFQ